MKITTLLKLLFMMQKINHYTWLNFIGYSIIKLKLKFSIDYFAYYLTLEQKRSYHA